jgi:hypothetical protein
MTYLLVKGVNGFGNMLSTLSFAFDLQQRSNRTLVIDWFHPEWRLGFDKYFEFKDQIKYMRYDDFLEKIKGKKLKLYPKEFENKLDKSLIELFPRIDSEPDAYQKLFGDSQLNVNLKKIDVVVFSYNYCGYNGLDKLFSNLIIKEELQQKIQDKINTLEIYKAIHIRHTDIHNESLNWVNKFLQDNLNTNIYLATDNQSLLDYYKKIHPKIFSFTNFYSSGKPLHTQDLTDDEKNQVNEDTISDLMILARSSELKITPQKTIPWMSTYSILAVMLHQIIGKQNNNI